MLRYYLEEKMKGTVVDGRIAKLFEGKLKHYFSCINVEFESSRIEEFKELSLNVKGCATLYDAFEKCPCPHSRGWRLAAHICTGTRLVPPTFAPGLGSPAATSAPGLGSFLPHLHRDSAHPLPHLHRDSARSSHICTGTGLAPAQRFANRRHAGLGD